MGGGKSNTGIAAVDHAVDEVSNIGDQFANATGTKDLANIGKQGVSALTSTINPDTYRALYQNMERGHRQGAADIGLMFKGNFNNAFQSLISGPAIISGMNPDDVKLGQTGSQRATNEATQNVADAESKDAANVIAEQQRQVSSVIAGAVNAYQRSPGRSQTLLRNNNGGTTNTLLTTLGNKR